MHLAMHRRYETGRKSIIEARTHRDGALTATSVFPAGRGIGRGKRARVRACWLNNLSLDLPHFFVGEYRAWSTKRQGTIDTNHYRL